MMASRVQSIWHDGVTVEQLFVYDINARKFSHRIRFYDEKTGAADFIDYGTDFAAACDKYDELCNKHIFKKEITAHEE